MDFSGTEVKDGEELLFDAVEMGTASSDVPTPWAVGFVGICRASFFAYIAFLRTATDFCMALLLGGVCEDDPDDIGVCCIVILPDAM